MVKEAESAVFKLSAFDNDDYKENYEVVIQTFDQHFIPLKEFYIHKLADFHQSHRVGETMEAIC